MKINQKKELFFELITYLLILLFSYAALSKLMDYDTFRVQLSQSPITTAYARLVSVTLPAGELFIAVALVIPVTRVAGLYASLFLMSLFTSYIYVILNYSFYIPCSCGGILGRMSWKTHFWFNITLVVITVIGILLEGTSRSTYRQKSTQANPTPVLT